MVEPRPEHRAKRRPAHRAPGHRRKVGPVALGLAVVPVLVIGGGATGAYWTGSDTVETGSLTAGTLDVVLNGDTDDDVTLTGLAVSDLLPGDARASTLAVSNVGLEASVRTTVTGRATGPLASSLQVELYDNGTAATPGSSTTGYTGTCTGTRVAGPVALGGTDTSLVSVAASAALPALAPGASRTMCVRVVLPAAAPISAQGQTASITLTLVGRSVVR